MNRDFIANSTFFCRSRKFYERNFVFSDDQCNYEGFIIGYHSYFMIEQRMLF
jgi:hypothetical protein